MELTPEQQWKVTRPTGAKVIYEWLAAIRHPRAKLQAYTLRKTAKAK
jgi:hypothetical protein